MTPKRGQKRKTVRPARQAVSPVVSAAYAKSKFGDLLKAVERGETVTIERYNRPVAKLSPAQEKAPTRFKFGFLKGLIEVLDPDWDKKATLSDEEIEELGKANY